MNDDIDRRGGIAVAPQEDTMMSHVDERTKLRFVSYFFPLFDELGKGWPPMFVKIGIYLELLQVYIFLFNPYIKWSSLVSKLMTPVYTLVLPLWSPVYVLYIGYIPSVVIDIVVCLLVYGLLAMLLFQAVWLTRENTMKLGVLTRVALFLFIGPMFAPVVHHLFAHIMCQRNSLDQTYLAAYNAVLCFDTSAPFSFVVGVASIVAVAVLAVIKTVVTLFVYDNHPLTDSYRGRTHSIVEFSFVVFQIVLIPICHAYLAAGQLTFPCAFLLATSLIMCLMHMYYLPFLHQDINRIRIIGLGVLAYFSMTVLIFCKVDINVFAEGSTYEYWDCLIVFPGTALVGLLLYGITDWRISGTFRRELARLLRGNADLSGGQRHAMRFPFYLPQEERSEFTERVTQLDNIFEKRTDSVSTASSSLRESTRTRTRASDYSCLSEAFWRDGIQGGAHGQIGGNDICLAAYIDAVYGPTDVELATRFVNCYCKVMFQLPSTLCLGFAVRIYAKGLARFSRDAWLELQLATFLCAFTSHCNPSAIAICEDLSRRELSPVMTYRLHHHASAINVVQMRRQRASKRAFMRALDLHKETLTNIRNFWKHLELEQASVSHLGHMTYTIIDGCYACIDAYVRAMEDHVEPHALARYAQFLDDVTLDTEGAMNTRKIAVELLEKRERGELRGNKVSIPTMRRQRSRVTQSTKLAWRFRVMLFAICLVMLLVLGVLLFMIIATHLDNAKVYTHVVQAGRCHALALRTMNTLQYLIMTADATSSSWMSLQQDLTDLRGAHEMITYKEGTPFFSRLVLTIIAPLYQLLFVELDQYEVNNLWRTGESYISSLETLLLSTSSQVDNYMLNFFLLNDINGALAAYNASLVQTIAQEPTYIHNSLHIVVALYCILLAMVIVIFFVFRYFMAYVSNMRLSALELFRLIPRSALHEVVRTNTERIEHFAQPDPVFESMLTARKLHFDRGYDYLDTDTVAMEVRTCESNSTQAPNTRLHSSSSVNDTESNARDEARHHGDDGSLLDADHDGINDEDEDEDGEGRGGAEDGGAAAAAMTGKFAQLYENSSLGDVGRLKFTQGEFEAPYRWNEFRAAKLTPDELAEQQQIAGDTEIKANLVKLQSKMDALRDSSDEVDRALDRLTRATAGLPSWSHYIFFGGSAIVIGLMVAAAVCSVGSIGLFKQSVPESIAILNAIQDNSFAVSSYVDDAEAFAHSGSLDTFSYLQDNLARKRLTTMNMLKQYESMQSKLSADTLATYLSTLNHFEMQLLTTVALSCSAYYNDTFCEPLSWITWSSDVFVPATSVSLLFNNSLFLPTSPDIDLFRNKDEKLQLITNVLGSPYYQYLKSTYNDICSSARSTVSSTELRNLEGSSDQYTTYKRVLVSVAVVAFALLALLLYIVRKFQRERSFLLTTLFTCLVLNLGLVVMTVILYNASAPHKGPFSNIIFCFDVISNLNSVTQAAHSNITSAAFAKIELNMVSFLLVGLVEFMSAWSAVFNGLGPIYFDTITSIYADVEFTFFLDAITMSLSCTYNKFNDDICALPDVSQQTWNIETSADGFHRTSQYAGTSQLLYTTREKDSQLPVEQQKALTLSLSYGPMRHDTITSVQKALRDITNNYTRDQQQIVDERNSHDANVCISITVVALCIAVLTTAVFLHDTLKFMEYSIHRGVASVAGAAVRIKGYTDSAFRRNARALSVTLPIFTLTLSVAFILIVVYDYLVPGDYRAISTATLRESDILASSMDLMLTINRPWYTHTASTYVEQSIINSETLYSTLDLWRYNGIAQQIFGSQTVTRLRFDNDYVNNFTVDGFDQQSLVLAFNGLLDPSQRRLRMRVQQMLDMPSTVRATESNKLRDDIAQLTEQLLSNSMSVARALEANSQRWYVAQLTVFCLTLVLFAFIAWYVLFPLVHALTKDEEGTQVMLRIIPAHVRNSVPTIVEYMATGRVVRDSNTAEINLAAVEFNILAALLLDEHGTILRFNRAAEELFLWTRAEACGQSASILMPDNTPVEDEQHILSYLNKSVEKGRNHTYTLRARRKDGTLFPATLQIFEVMANKAINYAVVVRNQKPMLDFTREVTLANSLTEAADIPFVIMDPTGLVQRLNPAAERMFRCTAADVVGRYFAVFLPRAEIKNFKKYLILFKTRRSALSDCARIVKLKRLNGELFIARLMVSELQQCSKGHFIMYFDEMTERMHQEVIQAAVNTIKTVNPVPLFLVNAEGFIVFCSESACRVFGYSLPSELQGRHLRTVIDDAVVARHAELTERFTRRMRHRARVMDDIVVTNGTAKRRVRSQHAVADDKKDDNAEDEFERRDRPESRDRSHERADSTAEGNAEQQPADTFAPFPARVTFKNFVVEDKGYLALYLIEDVTKEEVTETETRVGGTITSLSTIPTFVVSSAGDLTWANEAMERLLHIPAGEVGGVAVDTLFIRAEELGARGDAAAVATARNSVASTVAVAAPVAAAAAAGGTRRNPVRAVLDDFHDKGMSNDLGRPVQAYVRSPDGEVTLAVDVIVHALEQRQGRVFVVQLRDLAPELRLLEMQRWCEAFMSLATAAIVCTTLDSICFDCSDSACREFRWPREELIGRNVSCLMPLIYARTHDHNVSSFVNILKEQKNINVDGATKSFLRRQSALTGRTRDGHNFPIALHVQELSICGVHDILVSSLHNSWLEMNLAVQHALTRTLVDYSSIPFITTNRRGMITNFSSNAEQCFGYSAAEVVGRNVKLLMPEDIARLHDGYLRSFEKTGITQIIGRPRTLVARHKDGTLFHISLCLRDVRHGDMLEYMAFLDNYMAWQLKQQATTMLQMLSEAMTDPLLEVGLDGVVLNCNAHATETFVYAQQQHHNNNHHHHLSTSSSNGGGGGTFHNNSSTSNATPPASLRRRRSLVGQSIHTLLSPDIAATVTEALADTTHALTTASHEWLQDVLDELRARREQTMAATSATSATTAAAAAASSSSTTAHGDTTQDETLAQWTALLRRYRVARSRLFRAEPDFGFVYTTRRMCGRNEHGEVFHCVVYIAEVTCSGSALVDEAAMTTSHGSTLHEAAVTPRTDFAPRLLMSVHKVIKNDSLNLLMQTQDAVLSLSRCPFLALDQRGQIRLFNRAAEREFGYNADEVLSQSISLLLMPEYAERIMADLSRFALEANAATSTPATAEASYTCVFRRKNGYTFASELAIREIVEDGEEKHFIACLHERTTAAAAAAERAMSAALLEDTPLPLILVNQDGIITEFTTAAETLLRYSAVEVVGKHVRLLKAYPDPDLNVAASVGRRALLSYANNNNSNNNNNNGSSGEEHHQRHATVAAAGAARGNASGGLVQDYFAAQTALHEGPVATVEEAVVITRGDGARVRAVARIRPVFTVRGKREASVAIYLTGVDTTLGVQARVQSLTRLVRAAPVAVLVLSRRGLVMDGNAAAAELLRVERAELLNTRWAQWMPPAAAREPAVPGNETLQQAMLRSMQHIDQLTSSTISEAPLCVDEVRLRCGDGSVLYASATWTLVAPCHARDEPRGVVSLSSLMAAHEAAACRTRELVLQEATGVGTVEVDLEGRVVYCSDSLLRLLGHKTEAVVGANCTVLMPKARRLLAECVQHARRATERDSDTAMAATASVASSETSSVVRQVMEFRKARGSSGLRLVSETRALLGDDGRVCSTVTEVKLPGSMKETLCMINLLTMNASPELTLLASADGTILFANTAVLQAFAVPADAMLVGQSITQLVVPDERDTLLARLRDVMGTATTSAQHAIRYAVQQELVQRRLEAEAAAAANARHRRKPHKAHHAELAAAEKMGIESFGVNVAVAEVDLTRAMRADGLATAASSSRGGSRGGASGGDGARMLLIHMYLVEEQQREQLEYDVVDAALSCAFHATVIMDFAGTMSFASGAMLNVFGILPETVVGRNMMSVLLSPVDAEQLRQALTLYHRTGNAKLLEAPRRVVASCYAAPNSPSAALGEPVDSCAVEMTVHLLEGEQSAVREEFVVFFNKL